jgi:ribosomal protein S18 acetylase RimI-like enzyme
MNKIVKIRRGNILDIDMIYECHKQCFNQSDQWYRKIIEQNIDMSYVIEYNNTIIGILLYGMIVPCDSSDINNLEVINNTYKDTGFYLNQINGITMLCIHPEFRNKGLAKKLINIYLDEHKNNLVCLHTRKSNNAYHLYLKTGFIHIADIKDKYFFPNESSCFMIKQN